MLSGADAADSGWMRRETGAAIFALALSSRLHQLS